LGSAQKDSSGKIYAEGWIPATRHDLDCWMKNLSQPWSAAIEAMMFSDWIYDHLKPHTAALKIAHPLMLRPIAVAKKARSAPPRAKRFSARLPGLAVKRTERENTSSRCSR